MEEGRTALNPIVLCSNQPPERFYLGGGRIADFRGEPRGSDRVPEDWIASTTTLAGQSSLGLTILPMGDLLRAEVGREPVAWLGKDHFARYGEDTKLLVKLLDAGQRLPVHAHPGTAFAHQHLGRAHGKAEAWFILAGGEVFLGLKADISASELLALVEEQNVEVLLSLLHRRKVEPGDTVYVPPGVLHAIGDGTFLAEVQEPEDLSILLEWRDFDLDGAADGHLGLGFDVALGAVELVGRSEEAIASLITSSAEGDSVLAAPSAEYFRLGRYVVQAPLVLEAGFAVMIINDGTVTLTCATGQLGELRRGTSVVIPHAAGAITLTGSGSVLVCRPPKA